WAAPQLQLGGQHTADPRSLAAACCASQSPGMKMTPQDNGHLSTLIVPNVIDGQERSSSHTYASRNPANRDDVVTLAPLSTKEEVREACQKSRAAQRAWAHTPAPGRAQIIGRLGQILREEKESLSRFASREMGKPIREARGSVQEAIDTCDFFQSEGRRLYGQTVPSELPNKELFTYRRPIGVVGVITAGNFPIAVPSWKLIPAILCGNAVVWKPSEDAAGVATLFLELFRRAGLPDGVINVVHGRGPGGAGEALVMAAGEGLVDKISFTGSTQVGRFIGEVTGRALQVPSLELGGKNPLVILADADLELAIEGALWASFGTAGQRCTSAGNIIVDKRVMPTVRSELVRRARELEIGDPLEESTDYGPFINERFLENWIRQRATGLDDGAEL